MLSVFLELSGFVEDWVSAFWPSWLWSSRSEFFPWPKTFLLKFWNAIITTVTLSSDCLYKLFFSTLSTARPHCWCTDWAGLKLGFAYHLFLSHDSQTHLDTSSLDILSNTPSLASIMKSWFLCIWNYLISGSALTTFIFPPLYASFASGSPKVRETESRPGNTLIGPITYSGSDHLIPLESALFPPSSLEDWFFPFPLIVDGSGSKDWAVVV